MINGGASTCFELRLILFDCLSSSVLTGDATPESDLAEQGIETSDSTSLTSVPWSVGYSLEFFSRNAWEVFSRLRGSPMSYQRPVSRSLDRKRPGGSVLRTRSTIFLATSIFCFFVSPTYIFLFPATSSRKCMFPTWRLLDPPRPQRTSLA